MNRKGFTLVEVLVVIAILAILLLVLVPNVFVLINKNDKKTCNNLVKNIESAAKIYVTNNKYDLGFTCDGAKELLLRTLVESGDLTIDNTGKIINPTDDSDVLFDKKDTKYDNKVKVSVVYDCTSRQFDYEVIGIDCENE